MVIDKMEELVKGEVKRTFNPEFLNRLDEVIIFTSLTDTDLMQIIELLVQQMNANLGHKAITISVTDEAKQWIIEKTSSDRTYGARPLRRALQRFVEDPLSEALIAGSIIAAPRLPRGLPGEQPALLPLHLPRRPRRRRRKIRRPRPLRSLTVASTWVPHSSAFA